MKDQIQISRHLLVVVGLNEPNRPALQSVWVEKEIGNFFLYSIPSSVCDRNTHEMGINGSINGIDDGLNSNDDGVSSGGEKSSEEGEGERDMQKGFNPIYLIDSILTGD